MDIDVDDKQFAEWIGEILRCDFSEEEDHYSYVFSHDDRYTFKLEKDKLESSLTELRSYTEISDTVISNGSEYEVLVREEGPFFRFRPRDNDCVVEVEDNENKLAYRLIRPSTIFCLYLIHKASLIGEARELSRPMPLRRMYEQWTEEELCVLDLIKRVIGGRLTLHLKSTVNKSNQEFERFSSAFLFNLTYNTDSALVPQRDFEELLRSNRITRSRRFNLEELDPPRRYYLPDLIHHYQLAVGTENPMLEYISYYHIAEHFFESVFNDELIDKVKSTITHPDFSYKRKKDISSLIKDIGKSIKMRDESMTFNEQEGLRLSLIKFVDIDELVDKIRSYDEHLLEHYKTNTVSFAGGVTVNLESDDRDLCFKHLAGRIYKTRNAIVHSKESEKTKYTPFRDDQKLVKEVPLIRFVAEQIIFSTSQLA
ncbi:hypothetical protein [Halomonas koreensis]|uniref:Apea-like HEPN domain-containing protein n=1 Tax=Halomonas koreensis TaxID=245385 RepID=A0ABU1G174_9GAMM|nr:hypothetical protein [Halomonas koreensis]MDR5866217.1 hypothetical protein [Halomonas koreensis]